MKTQGPVTSVGIIGYGSMGAAMAGAFIRSKELQKSFSFCVLARHRQKAANGQQGPPFAQSLQSLVVSCDIIIIAVRPEQVDEVVRTAANNLPQGGQGRKILLSLAAGVPLESLRALASNHFDLARVMPNTLVEVGKGLFGLCADPGLAGERKSLVVKLLSGVGTVIELDENRMNAFTALAGCGPGFLFHIMDSFCEAGVSVGLTREASRSIAVSLMEGCGLLAETTGRHPAILREQGTSPAGMTIAGLNHLDMAGVRGHLIEAVKIAQRQGRDMDQEISPS